MKTGTMIVGALAVGGIAYALYRLSQTPKDHAAPIITQQSVSNALPPLPAFGTATQDYLNKQMDNNKAADAMYNAMKATGVPAATAEYSVKQAYPHWFVTWKEVYA